MVAAITLTPDNGVVGSQTTVSGSGFGVDEDLTITYDGQPIVPDSGTLHTDGAGAFADVVITIPAGVQGVHVVEVTDESMASDDANFTVNSQIVITEATANVGDTINVTGTGFATESLMAFEFNSAAIVPVGGAISSDVDGGFVTTFVVPAAPNGTRTLAAEDAAMNTDDDTIDVTALIALSVATGPFGTSVTVTGSGFTASSATTITANGNDVTGAALTTSAAGSFSRAVIIPDMPAGVNVIEAEDAAMVSDAEDFTMESSIVINPTSGETGSDIAIVCHGFAATEDISVTVDARPTELPTTPTTDADGLAAGVFTVPQDVALGAVTVSATDESANNATTSITITTAVTDPLNHGPMAQRKLPSGLFTTPVISVDGAAMEALLTIDARNYEKVLVMIQNIDDTNEADFNLFGSLESGESSPVFSTATWTQILASDVAIDKGVTKSLVCSDPYLWLVVAGKKHSGDDESQVLVYARGINNGHNS